VPFLVWLATAFSGAALLRVIHVLIVVGGRAVLDSAVSGPCARPGRGLSCRAIGGSLWMFA
jgi:hypothetical protein